MLVTKTEWKTQEAKAAHVLLDILESPAVCACLSKYLDTLKPDP
jgi:hypothetical protein